MKRLINISILACVISVFSCGPNVKERAKMENAKNARIADSIKAVQAAMIKAKNDSIWRFKHVIGEKYGGIMVCMDKMGQHGLIADTKDLPKANWEDAKKECEARGDGWHLPTKDELDSLFKYRYDVGGFADAMPGNTTGSVIPQYYWSSTEADVANDNGWAWCDALSEGDGIQYKYLKSSPLCVRAVKAF